ncbi:NRAMP (natural resistance-associated macrophage protein)-like metal ion transporter [Pelomonas aquatica]|uniref:NRAMP (Natural resistance-associated macrophage protein)-like metal ion transporter n=1 Tax=Pelomonas aquatica TaxID=431058 RepID=A0ABU1ZCT5_9BURK|nr:divalent metal cation transporter [Pelomonas aquatica]MDR7298422.1 NRAMP (natural resistance-associated macrophage protein)-like metal ion transporter [Pelomonas aquatica]
MKKPTDYLRQLGPGLITGAADDDPSGIATYSQAGAQFGFGMLWSLVFTLPLMTAIQIVSARIGYVSGRGLAANMKKTFPRPVLIVLVGLLLLANMLNIAADIAAMGAALHLLLGGPTQLYALGFGIVSVVMQVFLAYESYVRWLKWLTLALLAYVGVVAVIGLDWGEVLARTLHPKLTWNRDTLLMLVALLGTTISPYLFFWQASQEVEDRHATNGGRHHLSPAEVREHLRHIKLDTHIGMGFSNFIAFCIMLSTAATLHRIGVHDIETSAQAVEALRPVAGDHAALLFSLGIIGTGLLAVPVLAGSAAYAVSEVAGWRSSLSLKLEKGQGRGFYAVIAVATLGGVALCFAPVDPVKQLFWAAVFNGITAVPIMAAMMVLATRPAVMGPHVIGTKLRLLGWAATAVMATAVLALAWA